LICFIKNLGRKRAVDQTSLSDFKSFVSRWGEGEERGRGSGSEREWIERGMEGEGVEGEEERRGGSGRESEGGSSGSNFCKRCAARGLIFKEVDLRWGITEDQATRGDVLDICLNEIDLCRPYFVNFVGMFLFIYLSIFLWRGHKGYTMG
jgi:hypothetical protein